MAQEDDPNDQTGDLFEPPSDSKKSLVEPPSESVYADMGEEELSYVGEIQLPNPVPVELVVEVQGWDYYFTLTRRSKAQ